MGRSDRSFSETPTAAPRSTVEASAGPAIRQAILYRLQKASTETMRIDQHEHDGELAARTKRRRKAVRLIGIRPSGFAFPSRERNRATLSSFQARDRQGDRIDRVTRLDTVPDVPGCPGPALMQGARACGGSDCVFWLYGSQGGSSFIQAANATPR